MIKLLRCPHCNTNNAINQCARCGRHFVITEKRSRGGRREFEDDAAIAPNAEVQPCDYCLSKDDMERLDIQVGRGLSQKTCPKCHTEFLSSYGIDK